jgi:WD40 repeat protein/serine/threonine protein kinase
MLEDDSLTAFPEGKDDLPPDLALASGTDLKSALRRGAAGQSSGPNDWPDLAGYEVIEEVGRGGMGVVYKARQLGLNRLVAVKMIRSGGPYPLEYLSRFCSEAEAVARLRHPNIVQIYEVNESQGRPFLVFEFVAGGSLSQRLAARPVRPTQAAAMAETLARAVHAAHQQGVIHRDLKPANVLLQPRFGPEGPRANSPSGALNLEQWEPKITDFGLAKRLDGAPSVLVPGEQTRSGAILGTPHYMAPEQAAGRIEQIGPATDVYALGAILYEMLTGRPPFLGTSPVETLFLVGTDDPVPPRRLQPNCPRDLETICLKCLAKEPGKRYASALALAEDLRRFQDGEPIRARPVPVWERAARWVKRRPALCAVSGLAVLTLLAVALWYHLHILSAFQIAQELRNKAELGVKLSNRYIYLADMRLAQDAWKNGSVDRVLQLLENHRPKEGQPDLRGFEWYYLWRLCHSDRTTLEGHEGVVSAVAFSPDGKTLAVGCRRRRGERGVGEVRLWDLETERELGILEASERGVWALTFSPAGNTIAGGDFKGAVRLWDAMTGKVKAILDRPNKTVRALAFAPQGRALLAVGYENCPALIWDLQTKVVSEFPSSPERDGVGSLAFAPDGKTLAAAYLGVRPAAGHIVLWELTPAGKKVAIQKAATLHGHKGPVRALAFTPRGETLASAGEAPNGPGEIKLWDVKSRREKAILHAHTDAVTSLAIDRHGRLLASGGEDNTVRLWDLDAPREPLASLGGHLDKVAGLAFSPDGKTLASGSWDQTVKLWDVSRARGSELLSGAEQLLHAVTFSPDGKTLVAVGGDKGRPGERIHWNLATGRSKRYPRTHDQAIRSVAISPLGRLLATGGDGNQVKVWDETHKLLPTLEGHKKPVQSLAFSPDGSHLATASRDGTVRLWVPREGREVARFSCDREEALGVAFAPDGKSLAAGSGAGKIRVWDLETWKLVQTLSDPTINKVTSIAFSPDNKTLAAAGHGRTVRVWDWRSGMTWPLLQGHSHTVLAVAFSPDGKTLASASRDGTVKLWDPYAGEERATLAGNGSWFVAVAFSADGNMLAAASYDKTVRLWRAAKRAKGPGAEKKDE